MNAITVRNLPPKVAKAVREIARREKLSLNKAVVRLLEKATGNAGLEERVAYRDLDHLAGTWTESEYKAFMEALGDQRRIDPAMWE